MTESSQGSRTEPRSRDAVRAARMLRAAIVAFLLAALPLVAAACNKGGSPGY